DERLGGLHALDAPDIFVQELDELVVVFAHDLGEDVEAARGEHHVVDGGDVAELLGDNTAVAGDAHADHRLAVEAELHGAGDGGDLHDAGLGELLHALAHGRLGDAAGFTAFRVGASTVFLQLFDDRLRGAV